MPGRATCEYQRIAHQAKRMIQIADLWIQDNVKANEPRPEGLYLATLGVDELIKEIERLHNKG